MAVVEETLPVLGECDGTTTTVREREEVQPAKTVDMAPPVAEHPWWRAAFLLSSPRRARPNAKPVQGSWSEMCADRAWRKSRASKTAPAEAAPTVLVRPVRTRWTASTTSGALTA